MIDIFFFPFVKQVPDDVVDVVSFDRKAVSAVVHMYARHGTLDKFAIDPTKVGKQRWSWTYFRLAIRKDENIYPVCRFVKVHPQTVTQFLVFGFS